MRPQRSNVANRGCTTLVIPRGGAGLISTVVEQASVPTVETGVGNCHVYVDAAAELDVAERIVLNSKARRPSVCNAAETLLVHADVAPTFVPASNAFTLTVSGGASGSGTVLSTPAGINCTVTNGQVTSTAHQRFCEPD